MELFLKKISEFVCGYYKAIIIGFAALTILSLITVFRMKIETDIIDVLPGDNEAVMQFKDFMQKHGALDNITIVMESDSKTIEDHIDLIEILAGKLKKSPLIESVDYSPLSVKNDFYRKNFTFFLDETAIRHLDERLSPKGIARQIRLNRQRLLSPVSSPMDSELIGRDPLGISGIVMSSLKRSNKENRLDISAGYYFTKDHSTALIIAKPKGKSRDMAFVKDLKKELDAITQSSLKESSNPSDVKIAFTGGHIFSEEVRQVIRHDIISSSVLSVIIIALLIWLVYRVRALVLIIIGFTMLSSLSLTLALAYLLFGSLNIVTSIVAAVLIGLYVDYSMHMVKRFGDELKAGNDRKKALRITLNKTGSAIVVSAVTTSLSFFSIVVTKFEGLFELGIVAGIGVLLCLACNILLMSSMLVWAGSGGTQRILHGKETSLGVESLIRLVSSRKKIIILSSFFLVVLLGFGITKIRFDNDPEHIGVKDSQAVAAFKLISAKIDKKGDPLHIMIKGKDLRGLSSDFDSLEKILARWKTDGIIASYNSLSIILPAPHVQEAGINRLKKLSAGFDKTEKLLLDSLEKNNLAYERHYISTYLNGIFAAIGRDEPIGLEAIEKVPDQRIKHFYNKEYLSLTAYIYPAGTGWSEHSLDIIKADIRTAGGNWTLTGKSVLFEEIKTSIIRGSALAVITTLLLNVFVIYLFFRNALHTLFVMFPVTLGFLFVPGIMGYIHMPFNFINIGTVALIFGIGVDYGIYVMQAYLREDKKDTGNALRISGKNVMMCAATTVAGCGSLVTAKFAGIASMGIVLTIGAFFCAAIALVILPALLYQFGDRL